MDNACESLLEEVLPGEIDVVEVMSVQLFNVDYRDSVKSGNQYLNLNGLNQC